MTILPNSIFLSSESGHCLSSHVHSIDRLELRESQGSRPHFIAFRIPTFAFEGDFISAATISVVGKWLSVRIVADTGKGKLHGCYMLLHNRASMDNTLSITIGDDFEWVLLVFEELRPSTADLDSLEFRSWWKLVVSIILGGADTHLGCLDRLPIVNNETKTKNERNVLQNIGESDPRISGQ